MHLIVSFLLLHVGQVAGWELFEKTRFEWQYVDELGLEVQIPTFNPELVHLNGKEVTLTGYYLPLELESNNIIVSKLPYASCFFCGGGVGPESVLEVSFNSVQRPFRLDELLTVKGRLKLNAEDYDHLVFMLTDAKVVER